jgi:uncharacterized protein (DUF427 family)
MSLTRGRIAPLSRPTGGSFNIEVPAAPAHFLYHHTLPQRIRGELAGETVVDTTGATMLHETELLPRWYLPEGDVRQDLLEPSPTTSFCPFKGQARYWHLRVGDRLVEDAFWEYPEPIAGSPDLRGLLAPYVEKFDRWLEEDEELVGHPKDPFHRVDVRRSSRQVIVRAGDVVLAESTRGLALDETGLSTRWYLPVEDVKVPMTATATSSVCPYKGKASYWTVEAGGKRLEDAVWSYLEPRAEVGAIAGYVSFWGDGVEVAVSR